MSNHSLPAWGTDLPFSHYAWVEYYLQQNTYLQAVICRSHGELSANEKEGKNTSNDNDEYILGGYELHDIKV